MRKMPTLAALVLFTAFVPAAATLVIAAPADAAADGVTWKQASTVCKVAGDDYCQTWASGAFEMLTVVHKACPDHHLKPPEVWTMVNDYFGGHPDLRISGGVSNFVYKAATSRYPCPSAGAPQ